MKKKIINTTVVAHILIPGVILAILLVVINTSDVIQIKGLSPITVLAGDDTTIHSGNVGRLLDSAEKIAQYMNSNNPRFDYSWSNLPTRYNDGPPYSCCATFVSWCLQDAGFIDDSQHYDNVYGDNSTRDCTPETVPTDGVWSLVYNDPNWIQVIAKDETEMEEGDILIYKTGKSHTNIFAGLDSEGVRSILGCGPKQYRSFCGNY